MLTPAPDRAQLRQRGPGEQCEREPPDREQEHQLPGKRAADEVGARRAGRRRRRRRASRSGSAPARRWTWRTAATRIAATKVRYSGDVEAEGRHRHEPEPLATEQGSEVGELAQIRQLAGAHQEIATRRAPAAPTSPIASPATSLRQQRPRRPSGVAAIRSEDQRDAERDHARDAELGVVEDRQPADEEQKPDREAAAADGARAQPGEHERAQIAARKERVVVAVELPLRARRASTGRGRARAAGRRGRAPRAAADRRPHGSAP